MVFQIIIFTFNEQYIKIYYISILIYLAHQAWNVINIIIYVEAIVDSARLSLKV